MLLAYNDPRIKPLVYKQTIKKEGTFWSWLFRTFTNVFFDFMSEILVDTLTVAFPILLPANRLLKAGALFVSNLATQLIHDGEISWEPLFYTSAMTVGTFVVSKTLRHLTKSVRLRKAIESGKKIKEAVEFYKKSISEKIIDISKKSLDKYVKPSKALNARIKSVLSSQTVEKVVKSYRIAINAFKNPFSVLTQAVSYSTRKGKAKLMEQIAKIQEKQLTKGLQKAISQGKLTPKKANRYLKFMRTKRKRWIELHASGRSKWIRGVRLYHEEIYDQTKDITFMLYFDFDATRPKHAKGLRVKGKLPLELTLSWQDFWAFINAPSVGRYYLDNIAWDRTFGKYKINEGTILQIKEGQDLKEFIKRFRLINTTTSDLIAERFANFEEYSREVLKHRTNKTQLLASLNFNNGKAQLSFSRSPSTSQWITRTSIKKPYKK